MTNARGDAATRERIDEICADIFVAGAAYGTAISKKSAETEAYPNVPEMDKWTDRILAAIKREKEASDE